MKRYQTTHTRRGHRVTKHAQPNRAPLQGWADALPPGVPLDPLERYPMIEPIQAEPLTPQSLLEFRETYGALKPEPVQAMTHEEAIEDVKRALADKWVESGTTEGGIVLVGYERPRTPWHLGDPVTQETDAIPMIKFDQVRIIESRDFKAYAIPRKRLMRKLSRRKRSALLRRIWRRS